MNSDTFFVFGSIREKGINAKDIDLVIPEFADEALLSTGVSLDRYEQLSHETGKPIDLFFTTYEEGRFNVAGWYDPKLRSWEFRMAFCGKDFFADVEPIDRSELTRAAGRNGK
jgi:hypothetical protein